MDKSVIEKIKRSYLNEDFRFFHLKDKKSENHVFHYHDFNKIVIFISGDVTYAIEGKHYKLRPWDILFVSSSEVHKPIINPNEYYERIVIWVNSKFLIDHSDDTCDLLNCFKATERERDCLVRANPDNINTIRDTLFFLEKSIRNSEFGARIIQNAYFIQLIVYLNRIMLKSHSKETDRDVQFDERIINILTYINENLENDLSIENIAEKFYINRYYLMHNFKSQTGYTLHNYILQKRLAKASMLIKSGIQMGIVAEKCGFQDYSSFVRAFKRDFGLSPKQYYRAILEIDKPEGKIFEMETYIFGE